MNQPPTHVWLPREGSWEEAVLSWDEQVERSFARHRLPPAGESTRAEGRPDRPPQKGPETGPPPRPVSRPPPPRA